MICSFTTAYHLFFIFISHIFKYKSVIKSFVKNKEVKSIKLDPYRETADINESNNGWNTFAEPSRFSIFKQNANGPRRGAPGIGGNPMQRAQEKQNEKKAF